MIDPDQVITSGNLLPSHLGENHMALLQSNAYSFDCKQIISTIIRFSFSYGRFPRGSVFRDKAGSTDISFEVYLDFPCGL